ncbi:hypothetical protein F5Y14DRAFT_394985 [Nemania sp. NC0429]|nr:hypothetical protein F5Y14DRAFT_394985 [Nemania sp. NC0429]
MEAFLQTGGCTQPANDSTTNIASEDILKLELEHTQHLYDYLKPIFDTSVVTCLDALGQSTPKVSFEVLWYIFEPGTDVYVSKDSEWFVCVVSEVNSSLNIPPPERQRCMSGEDEFWLLEFWYLTFNGATVGRISTDQCIGFFPD